MQSIGFPKLFSKNTTLVKSDYDATMQNLKLLLLSEEGEQLDDPYFGVALKRFMYDQNNEILKDILIDEIYTKIATFMPQISLTRKDIKVTKDFGKCYANIKAINKSNFQTSMYNIVLFQEEER